MTVAENKMVQPKTGEVDIDWGNLGFTYTHTDFRYVSYWKDGVWDEGNLTEDNKVHISESSTALHYGQQCFEGLKAYRCKDGSVNIFRPDQNALRMQSSCQRLIMPEIPTDVFVDACVQVVKANQRFIPPYESGGSLYLRPYMIGVGDNLGVRTASEFLFGIFCSPVGPYFAGGLVPLKFITSMMDRAASNGTGAAKVGGNYAGSLLPNHMAKQEGYADVIYLDPLTHTKVEEAGAANFYVISADGKTFITPKSPSILPSITKHSMLYLAEHRLGLNVEQGEILADQLDQYSEAGACGTAAIVAPIGGVQHGDRYFDFGDVGPQTRRFFDELTGIQFGDIEAPDGWIVKVK